MKIAILHVSDIHLKLEASNPILDRPDFIYAAFQASVPDFDRGLLIISGDIAYQGDKAEYKMAEELISKLMIKLKSSGKEWDIIIIPGNHDCDVRLHDDTREALLQKLYSEPTREVDSGFIKNCLIVQQSFFEFAAKQMNRHFLTEEEKLRYQTKITFDNTTMLIKCFNTAWLSVVKEKQGSLTILDQLYSLTKDEKADCVVTIFHHPYNWLNADNARSFSHYAEETSDIILTGHEHGTNVFKKTALDGSSPDYYEGGVLQDSTYPTKSTFNVIQLDLAAAKKSIFQFEWNKDSYRQFAEKKDEPFCRSKYLIRNEFSLKKSTKVFLNDPGAQFAHPHTANLELHDIFVYPDVKELSFDSIKTTYSNSKRLNHFIEDFKKPSRTLLIGEDKSGRTTITKILYYLLHKSGDVPLLLNGNQLKRQTLDNVDAFLEKQFAEQYEGGSFEKYKQLPKDRKIIIVDDFHCSELNRVGKNKFIKKLEERASRLILFADELIKLEQFANNNNEESWLDGFRVFQIQSFGYVLRDELIKRWVTLGLEDVITYVQLERKVRDISNIVDGVLGNNLVPSQPIYLLIILQQTESQTAQKTSSGSFGYFYEYLITTALAISSHNVEIDLKYNYLSDLAYAIYAKKDDYLSEKEFYEFHSDYNTTYDLSLRYETVKNELLQSRIITLNSNNGIEFRYKYCYYYFLARHISTNLHDPKMSGLVAQFSETIYAIDSSNVLIFLSYLSKDPSIVDSILKASRALYQDCAPCDLINDVDFLNNLQAKVPGITLHDGDARIHRQAHLKNLDDYNEQNPKPSTKVFEPNISQAEESKIINDILRITVAFKSMEILGQILKNYSGSLKGEIKTELATECFSVGLRTLSFFYKFFDKHIEGVIHIFSSSITQKKPEMSQEQINAAAKAYIFVVLNVFALGIVKRIAISAGSEKLEKTYDHLRATMGLASVDIIDLAIRLDHFSDFPEKESVDVYEKVRKNYFAQQIVQRLVAVHFYLFPVDHSIRDRICQKLEISVRKETALDERIKMSRS